MFFLKIKETLEDKKLANIPSILRVKYFQKPKPNNNPVFQPDSALYLG